jgi:hypothetical protein
MTAVQAPVPPGACKCITKNVKMNLTVPVAAPSPPHVPNKVPLILRSPRRPAFSQPRDISN